MKKETIFSIIFLVAVISLVIGVGYIVIMDVAKIPFKLCDNKTGLIMNPEEDYIWYDCDKVNNITIALSQV